MNECQKLRRLLDQLRAQFKKARGRNRARIHEEIKSVESVLVNFREEPDRFSITGSVSGY